MRRAATGDDYLNDGCDDDTDRLYCGPGCDEVHGCEIVR